MYVIVICNKSSYKQLNQLIKMKKLLTAMFAVLLFAACNHRSGHQPIDYQPVEEVDTLLPETTIQDILNWRKAERETIYKDSLWLSLPDEIIVAICVQYGTNLTQYEIVDKYLKHKEFYKGYLKGIKNINNTNKEYIQIPHLNDTINGDK